MQGPEGARANGVLEDEDGRGAVRGSKGRWFGWGRVIGAAGLEGRVTRVVSRRGVGASGPFRSLPSPAFVYKHVDFILENIDDTPETSTAGDGLFPEPGV